MDFYVRFLVDLTILFQLHPLKVCDKVTFSTLKSIFKIAFPYFSHIILSLIFYEAEIFK